MRTFAIYKTELGFFKMEEEDGALVYFKKLHDTQISDFGAPSALSDAAHAQLLEYFAGKRTQFSIPYRLKGTDFQQRVWKALLDIPYGQTRSYKDIAEAVGSPKGSRAVGMANNKNPITVIVPCHRVIGASGKLVGYAGGLEMKEFLLHMEQKGGAR